MSQVPVLGKIIADDNDVKRDAVHIAIFPAIAAADLTSGEQVRLAKAGTNLVIPIMYNSSESIGVVDPFFQTGGHWPSVKKGEKCWVLCNPNSISALRHEWEHPLLVSHQEVNENTPSVTWLTNFAGDFNMSYETLLQYADESINDGYLTVNSDASGTVPAEFWTHYEKVKNIVVSEEVKTNTQYSCSC